MSLAYKKVDYDAIYMISVNIIVNYKKIYCN